MKIIAFNGSPRAERGNTHIMVESFLNGARSAGAQTENIHLSKKNIKHCLGCFTCWTKTPGKCVIKDDMSALLEKYIQSDIVIEASPLYVDFVTGIMKDFMDRRIPIVCPQFEKGASGETVHVKRFEKYPSVIYMSNCGFPEHSQFEVLKLFCERRIKNNVKIIAQIYRSQGELLRQTDKELEPIINNYKTLLEKAGSEVVTKGKLAEETVKELEKPLISEEEYSKAANSSW